MKSMKRYLSVTLILSMVLSTMVFGAENLTRNDYLKKLVVKFSIEIAEGEISDFADVDAADQALYAALKKADIVNGYEDKTVRPQSAISKQEAVVFALKAAGVEVPVTSAPKGNAAAWAANYIDYAIEKAIVSASDDFLASISSEGGDKILAAAIGEVPVAQAKPALVVTATPFAPVSTNYEAFTLLLESVAAQNALDSFKAGGNLNIDMTAAFSGESLSSKGNTTITCAYQKPGKVYYSTNVLMDGQNTLTEIVVDETGGLYTRVDGGNWRKSDMDMETYALTNASSGAVDASNVILSEEQITKSKSNYVMGAPEVIDGVEYKVVSEIVSEDDYDARIDEMIQSGIMDNIMDSVLTDADLNAEQVADAKEAVIRLYKSMKMSSTIKYYINPETKLILKADMSVNVIMNTSIMEIPMNMTMTMNGGIFYTDINSEVTIPAIN